MIKTDTALAKCPKLQKRYKNIGVFVTDTKKRTNCDTVSYETRDTKEATCKNLRIVKRRDYCVLARHKQSHRENDCKV